MIRIGGKYILVNSDLRKDTILFSKTGGIWDNKVVQQMKTEKKMEKRLGIFMVELIFFLRVLNTKIAVIPQTDSLRNID